MACTSDCLIITYLFRPSIISFVHFVEVISTSFHHNLYIYITSYVLYSIVYNGLIVSAVVLLCTAMAVIISILVCFLWKNKKMKIQEKRKEMLTLDVMGGSYKCLTYTHTHACGRHIYMHTNTHTHTHTHTQCTHSMHTHRRALAHTMHTHACT